MFSNIVNGKISSKNVYKICDDVSSKEEHITTQILAAKQEKAELSMVVNEKISQSLSSQSNHKICICLKLCCEICNYKTSKTSQKFLCEKCNYETNKKSNMDSHLLSKKHKKNENLTLDLLKSTTEYICLNCNKEYKDNSGLWRHKKKCKKETQIIVSNKEPSVTELVTKLINQNSELQQMLIDQNNKMFELAKEAKCVTTNNTTNNNQFNLNVFLNEKCKDAVNLVDFVDSLEVQLSDLEETARLGYSEGISRIFINGINDLDVFKRPIHCSDAKRETLYIKDQNEWTKEDTNKSHLSKAIKVVSSKNIQQIFEWQKKYPEYKDPDSKQSDTYMEMICNTMCGSSKEEHEQNMNKIIKNVTKEVVIDKTIT